MAQETIEIFLGTQQEQILACQVLEYSIRKHASLPVKITPLFAAISQAKIAIPEPRKPENKPKTPFSFQRFAIPELMNYQGRAIYLDSDMQVFQDIAQLWYWDFQGADLLSVAPSPTSQRLPQFSVMVLNCEQLRWNVTQLIEDLDAGKWTYQKFIYQMAPAAKIASVLPTQWNSLEHYEAGKTALTHYTDMPTQPWLSVKNPLGWLWCQELFNAINDGFIQLEFIQQEVRRGWIRPSLLYQLKHQIVDPLKLPKQIINQDYWHFLPPHAVKKPWRKVIHGCKSPVIVKQISSRLYILARYLWQEIRREEKDRVDNS